MHVFRKNRRGTAEAGQRWQSLRVVKNAVIFVYKPFLQPTYSVFVQRWQILVQGKARANYKPQPQQRCVEDLKGARTLA
jgi:hypothetical protein